MDQSTLDSVLSGISSSDTVFYVVAAAVLVVLAGIWGFGRILDLLDSDDSYARDSDAHFERCQGMTSNQINDRWYGTRNDG